MTRERFAEITARYSGLRVAIVGDFCLDRYFEIDPARNEISIETGRTVHNVTRVRCQPGAAGTILNNLVALGVGRIRAVGFCGEDGEGFELLRALRRQQGVSLDLFVQTPERVTFTYSKPLVLAPGRPPLELDRLDIKNWSPTPEAVRGALIRAVRRAAEDSDAIILLDQVDVPETGVITRPLLAAVGELAAARPELLIIADSRRSLKDYPPVSLKMNRAELAALTGLNPEAGTAEIEIQVRRLANRHGRQVFVSLAEQGILSAAPGGEIVRQPALPVRGEIDVVGAGDAVMANLTTALAAGAAVPEALKLAMAAASVVVHQLGTTGTASKEQLAEIMGLRNA